MEIDIGELVIHRCVQGANFANRLREGFAVSTRGRSGYRNEKGHYKVIVAYKTPEGLDSIGEVQKRNLLKGTFTIYNRKLEETLEIPGTRVRDLTNG